jgi:hypothetical protein
MNEDWKSRFSISRFFGFWNNTCCLTTEVVDRGEVKGSFQKRIQFRAQALEALLARIMLACDTGIVLPMDSLETLVDSRLFFLY